MANETSVKSDLPFVPNRKKNFGFPKCYPFPIVRDSGEGTASWNCVIGHLREYCVEVTEEKDMDLLFFRGFFGKGTLSRSTPQVLEKKVREKLSSSNSKAQTDQSEGNFLSLSVEDKDKGKNEEENPAKRKKKDEVEVLLSDSNESSNENMDEGDTVSASDVDKELESKKEEKETLQLSLEEAFFLSYTLGVLVVKDKDQPLDLMREWHKFCEIHPNKNFPVMYTAYHHFRSKGWIVRSGIKYGCDYVLYKDGPPFYHSTYAVIVKPVKEKNFRDVTSGGRPHFTWGSLAAVHRICSHANKGLLILYVIKPAAISENKISTPFCVSQYEVEEVIVKRWVPSEEQRPDA